MALLTALAVGSAVAAGVANTAYNHWQYADTKKFNSAEAQKQRDFEERMSNTAYQRATKDMQAAGLNPAMMYGSGSAASTPSSSAASVNANGAGVDLGINSIANLLNSASSIMSASGKGTKAYRTATKIITSAAKILG